MSSSTKLLRPPCTNSWLPAGKSRARSGLNLGMWKRPTSAVACRDRQIGWPRAHYPTWPSLCQMALVGRLDLWDLCTISRWLHIYCSLSPVSAEAELSHLAGQWLPPAWGLALSLSWSAAATASCASLAGTRRSAWYLQEEDRQCQLRHSSACQEDRTSPGSRPSLWAAQHTLWQVQLPAVLNAADRMAAFVNRGKWVQAA